MMSWQTPIVEFVRSYWMPVSAFFGIPFVALANHYRRSDIDFTYLSALDVANLSFSLWGSFLISYFTVFCFSFVSLRIIPFYMNGLTENRALKFMDSGRLKDPLSVVRYIDATDRIKLENSEAFLRTKTNHLLICTFALFLSWTTIWNLPFESFVLTTMICYGLFKFDDATRRLRQRLSWKPYKYDYALEIRGTREERIERFKNVLEEHEARPNVPLPKLFRIFVRDLPKMLRFDTDWQSTQTRVTAAVSLLVVALNFGSARANTAKDGPEHMFWTGNIEFCGKLVAKTQSGYHITVGQQGLIVFLPEVSVIEELPVDVGCPIR